MTLLFVFKCDNGGCEEVAPARDDLPLSPIHLPAVGWVTLQISAPDGAYVQHYCGFACAAAAAKRIVPAPEVGSV